VKRSNQDLFDAQSTNKDFYYRLAGVAFVLNWIWEMPQMFAFQTELEKSWLETTLFCTLATIVDVLVILAVCKLAEKFTERRGWIFYLATAFWGALCAAFFEKFAFAFGLWNYNEQMPVVPLLGVGVLPFAQLLILVPLSIWLAGKLPGLK
jgi:hypothetical protein